MKPVATVPTMTATIVEVWTMLNQYDSSEGEIVEKSSREGDGAKGVLVERSSGRSESF